MDRILRGVSDAHSDAHKDFSELCGILQRLGFEERVRGDHHIFSHDGVPEILNLQPKGQNAKPYQVKQVELLS
jgi:hypothetical protein